MRSTTITMISKSTVLAALTIAAFCRCVDAQENSYAHMLNVTMTASQNLFVAQTAVNKQRESMRIAAGQPVQGSTTSPQAAVVQYPITATDFRPLSPRMMPDQFANAATGVDQATRETMRTFFNQVLTAYESKARKNNFANAFAFVCSAALEVRNGRQPGNAEIGLMTLGFNNRLAASPAYYAFNPQQQQMLYESLIIIGGIVVFLDYQGKQTNNAQLRDQAREMSDAVLKAFLGI